MTDHRPDPHDNYASADSVSNTCDEPHPTLKYHDGVPYGCDEPIGHVWPDHNLILAGVWVSWTPCANPGAPCLEPMGPGHAHPSAYCEPDHESVRGHCHGSAS
jgi:hypothetical protein